MTCVPSAATAVTAPLTSRSCARTSTIIASSDEPALAGLLLWGVRRIGLPPLQRHGHRLASAAAMAAGVLWFVERVAQAV